MHILIEDVTKRFGELEAVSHVTLDIREGELFTLLGPSGCGKTTLLRLVAGFYYPDEGRIRFRDRPMHKVPPYERNIGMVFQNYALWPHMSVHQNVVYGLKLKRLSSREISEQVRDVLAKVNLTGLEQRYPGQLSAGQQQRVALARALVLNPHVLLLDEPLSNLDAKIRIQVRAEIRRLQKELGITTIYVTHDQEEALSLSDRIAVIDRGRVLQVGTPKDLYEQPATRFVADFIGTNNLIEGTVQTVDPVAHQLRVETPLGELVGLYEARPETGQPCVLCIRPENVTFDGSASAGADKPNRVTGIISFASYLGNIIRYDVETAGGVVLKVDINDPRHHQTLAQGSRVTVSFPVTSTLAIPKE
ncbi:MAG: ABC transporter ATP-binding protein [Candidatus Methylomirabilales bacterium]